MRGGKIADYHISKVENIGSREGKLSKIQQFFVSMVEWIKALMNPSNEARNRFPEQYRKLDEEFEKWDKLEFLRETRRMFAVALVADIANVFIDSSSNCKVEIPSRVLCGEAGSQVAKIRLVTACVGSIVCFGLTWIPVVASSLVIPERLTILFLLGRGLMFA
ncbi:hypothetical protein HDU76_003399 [Blyttiomyces sp. JEL0837]|nr:hypothetical protein HDU76_003399 [Blyttiomyces sp. JEL0837]